MKLKLGRGGKRGKEGAKRRKSSLLAGWRQIINQTVSPEWQQIETAANRIEIEKKNSSEIAGCLHNLHSKVTISKLRQSVGESKRRGSTAIDHTHTSDGEGQSF